MNILSWVLLALLALSSAILCFIESSLANAGAVYGVLLGVYFVSCRGVRSAVKLIALVIACAFSWLIVLFTSLVAAGFVPGGTVPPGDVGNPAFPLIAFEGVLGGLTLLLPVLLLFKPSSASSGAALVRVFWGILLSGIVGGIAWELGPTLGATIWGLHPSRLLPQPIACGMAALFFVWQPVMALFIGWATSGKQQAAP
jgi:hypothetical protein